MTEPENKIELCVRITHATDNKIHSHIILFEDEHQVDSTIVKKEAADDIAAYLRGNTKVLVFDERE